MLYKPTAAASMLYAVLHHNYVMLEFMTLFE